MQRLVQRIVFIETITKRYMRIFASLIPLPKISQMMNERSFSQRQRKPKSRWQSEGEDKTAAKVNSASGRSHFQARRF
jgi:hypothetical protein